MHRDCIDCIPCYSSKAANVKYQSTYFETPNLLRIDCEGYSHTLKPTFGITYNDEI